MKKVIIYFSLLALFLFVGLSSVYAGFNEGVAAYERAAYETALQEFKPLAEQRHAEAQFYLGLMYYMGQGVSEDYAEAFKWFRKAAEQGHAVVQFNIGGMYYMGQGVPKDYAEALKWYKNAAEQGHAGAQLNLGGMYASGRGVPRDYVMSYMWANLAASQGEETASELRSIVEKEMTPEQIVEAQRLSREFKVKSP
jgi:hypothetical protein